MQLSEFFDQLAHGELAHLFIGGSGQGIEPEDYDKVVGHINLGLTEIYSRFNLKSDVVTIQQIPAFTTYVLDSRYAKSNPLNTLDSKFPKYIIDTAAYPFQNDIVKIDAVQDELGVWWGLNDESCKDSMFTMGHNIINTPHPSIESALFVYYRAKAANIVLGTQDPASIIIDVPPQFHSALLAYVAHRIFAGKNAKSAEAQIYLQKFLEICAFVEATGLVNVTQLYNNRLECKGWV